jgi:hypothetical protein
MGCSTNTEIKLDPMKEANPILLALRGSAWNHRLNSR